MEAGSSNLISDIGSSTLDAITITANSNDKEQSLITPDDKDGCSTNLNIKKWLFSVIAVSNYLLLAFLAFKRTHTAVQMLTWLMALCSSTYVLLVAHTLLFSKKLCYHTVDYELMRGSSSNYLPRQINVHHQIPYETICMFAYSIS